MFVNIEIVRPYFLREEGGAAAIQSDPGMRNARGASEDLSEYRKKLEIQFQEIVKPPAEYYRERLNQLLHKHKMTQQDLDAWYEEVKTMGLESDLMIKDISNLTASQKVREFEKSFFQQGAANFSSEKFRTCLENMHIYTGFLKGKYEGWEQQLTRFRIQIDEVLNKGEAVPYKVYCCWLASASNWQLLLLILTKIPKSEEKRKKGRVCA